MLLRLYNIFLSNHHDFAQLALGAFSSYDTAPASVFKGLPLLLVVQVISDFQVAALFACDGSYLVLRADDMPSGAEERA